MLMNGYMIKRISAAVYGNSFQKWYLLKSEK